MSKLPRKNKLSRIWGALQQRLTAGQLDIGSYRLSWTRAPATRFKAQPGQQYKVHLGPGAGWQTPGPEWLTVDVDPARADILIDFNSFERLSLADQSVLCVYGSHVFEHVSIYKSTALFRELYRVLVPGGYFRLVLPHVQRSIEAYVQKNIDYPLFKRRRDRAKQQYHIEYTLFECLREDFISPSGQAKLLGRNALAHQNAWDLETLRQDLCRVGFEAHHIHEMSFRHTQCADFAFEGTYPSEANEHDRSLYVEVQK